MLRYLVLGAIFYVLVPGILLSLPKGGSKKMTALTHAIVFVGAYYLAEKLAEMSAVKPKEGFQIFAHCPGGTWNAKLKVCEKAAQKDPAYEAAYAAQQAQL